MENALQNDTKCWHCGKLLLAPVSGWAAASATEHQCVVITFGETERQLTRDDAERFAAAIYEACSDSCKFSFVKNKQPNDQAHPTAADSDRGRH